MSDTASMHEQHQHSDAPDPNAEVWRSAQTAQQWSAEAGDRERERAGRWLLMAQLLPFDRDSEFCFLDLGAGTGAAARTVLTQFPASTGVLADFSTQMMAEAAEPMRPFGDRVRFVEFDMASGGPWPDGIPATVDAVVTSLCVHHLPDERKRGLFAEIFARLAPGGWYLNYDPISPPGELVEQAWRRAGDRADPQRAAKRAHRTADEQRRWDNHVRHIAPLGLQLDHLRAAGFEAIDVFWKSLDEAVCGGRRPA